MLRLESPLIRVLACCTYSSCPLDEGEFFCLELKVVCHVNYVWLELGWECYGVIFGIRQVCIGDEEEEEEEEEVVFG